MKIELKKEPKKSAIVCYGTRITLDGLNVRVVDMIYLRKYLLEELGRSEVDFVTKKTKADEKYDYVKDTREVNINDYDEVIIYNCVPNVFGGIFKSEAIDTFKMLYEYTNGIIWYFFCEEAAFPSDFSRFVAYKRYGQPYVKTTAGNVDISDEYCDAWRDKVYANMKVMFIGDDYDAYVRRYNSVPQKGKYADCGIKTIKADADWAIIPLNEYYSIAEDIDAKLKEYPFEREYDLVYYGNQRAGRRNKVIANLYDHPEMKTMFVGYDPEFKNSTPKVYPYVNHDEMFPLLCQAYATVILCSDSHADNIRSVRFFEALNLDLVGFMWHEYNEDRHWIHNEELRDFIYINSYDELKEKIAKIKSDEKFFRHIIDLEREEVKRYYDYSVNLYK